MTCTKFPLGIYDNGSCQVKVNCASITPITVAADTSGELALWVEIESGDDGNIPHLLHVDVYDFVDSSDFNWCSHVFAKPHPNPVKKLLC